MTYLEVNAMALRLMEMVLYIVAVQRQQFLLLLYQPLTTLTWRREMFDSCGAKFPGPSLVPIQLQLQTPLFEKTCGVGVMIMRVFHQYSAQSPGINEVIIAGVTVIYI